MLYFGRSVCCLKLKSHCNFKRDKMSQLYDERSNDVSHRMYRREIEWAIKNGYPLPCGCYCYRHSIGCSYIQDGRRRESNFVDEQKYLYFPKRRY